MSKALKFYEEWGRKKKLPSAGLCCSLTISPRLRRVLDVYFTPSSEEWRQLLREGLCAVYWGSGLRENDIGMKRGFTSLRQTILLFLDVLEKDIRRNPKKYKNYV